MATDSQDQRKQRLAAALRENLKRRKQQDRGRRTAAPAPEADGATDLGDPSPGIDQTRD